MTKKLPTPKLKPALKKLVARLADSGLPEAVFVPIFILGRWYNNSDFSYPSEIWLPIILLGVIAAAVYYLYRLILGPGLAAHIAALLLAYSLYAFQFLEGTVLGRSVYQILPGSTTPFAKSLALVLTAAVICGLVGWLAKKALSKYKLIGQLQPYKILLFAIVFIFSLQLIKVGGRLLDISSQLSYQYQPAALGQPAGGPKPPHPDIYYLVFDRYGSPETLQDIYGFDMSSLTKFLDGQGFVTRKHAYANYPFTMSSVSSTMAMQYSPELGARFGDSGKWQTAFPYRSILNDPPIAKQLARHGYKYNQLSSWWDFTRIRVKADNDPVKSFRLQLFNRSIYLSDLQRDIFNKSVLAPWLKKGITLGGTDVIKYDLNRNPRQNFEAQLEALADISSRQDKSTPQFSFAHVLVPHDPYVFAADGSEPAYDPNRTDNGVDEHTKYTNQVSYLNGRLKALLTQIRNQSPDAVIIIQADEGPYPKEFRGQLSPDNYYDPARLELPQMKQKFSILASYYFPGASRQEAEKMTASVNVFRFTLNQYLGYQLPMLPDCHFSTGNKFTVYKYQLVTDKLTGKNPPSECGNYK